MSAAEERAARLRRIAEGIRRTPATGATVHDLATIRGLADSAADIADQVAAGTLPADDWRHGWLDRAEAQIAVYLSTGLDGWRRVYRR